MSAIPVLVPYAHCCNGCGPLEFDGTPAGAGKAADKHTKATGHTTGAGITNTAAPPPENRRTRA